MTSPQSSSRTRTAATWICILLASIFLACILVISIRTLMADHYAERHDFDRAIQWRPDISDYWRMAAEDPANSDVKRQETLIRHSIALNPYDPQSWQYLAELDFENKGNSAAIADLRAAQRYSNGFKIHYTLANLAYLAGNMSLFWNQLRACTTPLLVNVPDPEIPVRRLHAVLQLAIQAAPNDNSRLLSLLPRRNGALTAEAVHFLAQRGELTAASAAWGRLQCTQFDTIPCGNAAAELTNALLTNSDKATGSPNDQRSSVQTTNEAIRVWNDAVKAGILVHGTAARGKVADPLFKYGMQGYGFSWISTNQVFVSVVPGTPANENAIQIDFDGTEPEDVALLSQRIALTPGATYVFTSQMKNSGLSAVNGIHIQLYAHGKFLLDESVSVPPRWGAVSVTAKIPSDVAVARLLIAYRRPTGEVRLNVPVQVESPRLQEVSDRPGGIQ